MGTESIAQIIGFNVADLLGLSGLIVVLFMVFTFRLVPRKYYDETLARVEVERTRGDNWEKVARSLLKQNTLLLQRDDISLTALQAIRDSVEEGRVDP